MHLLPSDRRWRGLRRRIRRLRRRIVYIVWVCENALMKTGILSQKGGNWTITVAANFAKEDDVALPHPRYRPVRGRG